MGGMIPGEFRERKKLRPIQEFVAKMEPFTKVILMSENIKGFVEKGYEYLDDEMIREAVEMANEDLPGFKYLHSEGYDLPTCLFASTFVEKARRGFRSFARLEYAEVDKYILIAEPEKLVDYKGYNLCLEELDCQQSENGMIIKF